MKRKTRAPSASTTPPEGKKKKVTGKGENSSESSATATKGIDYSSPTRVIESLLSPTDLDAFLADNWEKKPLCIKRENADFYGSLFSKKDLETILKKEEIQFVEDIDLSRFVEGKTELLNGEGRVNLKDIKSAGVSVRFNQPQRFQDEVWKLLEPLETYFGCIVGADAFVFQPGSQGLAPQFDEIEMFVLQLEGKNHWKLFKPLQELPQEPSPDLELDDVGEPTHEFDLEPGDLLYFPRGTVYHAAPVEDKEHSTCLAITTFQENAWGNMLTGAMSQAVEKAMENNIEYRRGLPVNLFSFMGSRLPEADKEESAEQNGDKSTSNGTASPGDPKREAFKTNLVHLLKGLADHLIPDKAVDEMLRDFYGGRLPPFGKDDKKGKKKILPSDVSKIKLLHPEHVRIIVGDLSDGFAAAGEETDNDDGDSESSEEEMEEEDTAEEPSEESEKDEKNGTKKTTKKQKPNKKEKKADKEQEVKAKKSKAESGGGSEEKEDGEEEDDDDEDSADESGGFENEGGGDEYILVLHSVNNERATHMMGEKMPCSTLKFPFRFKDALRQIASQQDDFITVSGLQLPEKERLSLVKSLWSDGLLGIE